MRLGDNGICRRTVGPAVDHDRHSRVALGLAGTRLMAAKFLSYLTTDATEGAAK